MNTAVKVARMHIASTWTFIGVPALILGAAILISIGIFLVIPSGGDMMYAGSAQAPLWYFAVLGVQALTLSFPFSQAMSVSRRSYFLGTAGLFTVMSLIFALLYLVLAFVEEATAGWGLNGYMFAIPWITGSSWPATVLFIWTAALFVFFVGFWAATIYKRWGTTTIVVTGIALGIVLVGLLALVNFTDNWAALGEWFAGLTPLSVAGVFAALVVVLGGGSYLTLRRATP